IATPTQLGSYQILYAYQVGDAVFFYEANGAGFDDAGFAYLPNGPDASFENTLFEAPSYNKLGGPWYSWTASW
nr:hypothetical protein [Micromonospora sp. DSM 115978]